MGYFFLFFGGCCPPSSSDKFCRFLEKTFGKFLFSSANSTNFPILGQFRQILHVTKLQKNRSPGFGHFFGGNLKKKLPKFYISQKKTLVLGGFSLVILENIRQILNITELDISLVLGTFIGISTFFILIFFVM